MIRALKVVLIVNGVMGILLGLVFIVAPDQAASMMGFVKIADLGVYIAALCGAGFVTAGVWLIVAGRDPLRHITWVKFAILWNILAVVVSLFLIFRGTFDFSQIGMGIIVGAVFAVAFLVLYPYRAAYSSE